MWGPRGGGGADVGEAECVLACLCCWVYVWVRGAQDTRAGGVKNEGSGVKRSEKKIFSTASSDQH